jgi:uncharacterized protein YndB with AHSA1/START domain
MNDVALKPGTQDIVVDEVFPHAPETIWKTLTTGELIGRWIEMPPTGFEPVKGNHFTFQTRPAGAWDGIIHCQVLEVMPNERLVYSWKADTKETSDTGHGWTPSSRGRSPGRKTEPAFALSIPASSRRRTTPLSRA